MTTYTNITNAAVAVGAIPSSVTVTALRDNPIAIAEAENGAPVVFAGWHPHDKQTIGDGKTGLIYDFAADGAKSTVVSPDFVDGYEYRIIAADISSNSASSVRLTLDAFYQTDAEYKRLRYSAEGAGTAAGILYGCDITIGTPRITKRFHFGNGWMHRGTNVTFDLFANEIFDETAQKILRARLRFVADGNTSNPTGSIDGGKIYMFRRREYASAP